MTEKLVCRRYQRVAYAHTAPKEAIFTRLRCKQWSCAACAKTNQWIWRNWLLKRLPDVSEGWWLLTLTAVPWKRDRWGSMDNIRSNLDRFFKRVRRVFGDIEYVRVFEKHPTSQAIHCHIIICGITPFVAVGCSAKLQPMALGTTTRKGRNGSWAVKTWVKKIAQDVDMGHIADIRRLEGDPSRAAWYVTKYLTKSQEDLHVKGLRHVQVTKGIGSPPESDKGLEWNTAAYITAEMVGHKSTVIDINTGFVIEGDNYWEVKNFYPDE